MADEALITEFDTGCSQRAYLYLMRDADHGDPPYDDSVLDLMAFDPTEVTALVGLQPTAAWRRGDPVPGSARLRRVSAWKYELPEVHTFITEDVVVPLLDAIEPYAEGITTACRTLGMRAGIMVVVCTRGARDADGDLVVSTPAIGYGAQTMDRLARLRLALEHDQYLELPDR